MDLKGREKAPGWKYPKAIVIPNETPEHAKERAAIDKKNQETMKIGKSLGWTQEETIEHINRENILRYLPPSANAEKPGETPEEAGARMAKNMFGGAFLEWKYNNDPEFAKEVQARAARDGWTPNGPSAAALKTDVSDASPTVEGKESNSLGKLFEQGPAVTATVESPAPDQTKPLTGRSITAPSETVTPSVKQAIGR